MRWVGARDAALVSAGSRADTTQEDSIGQLQFRDLYPGISLVYHRRFDAVEYDLWIAPHADPAAIRFEVSGADAVWLDADGDLVIRSGRELFFQRKPVSYQMKGEIRTPVDSAFRQVSPGEFGFWLGDYDRTAELVIDPVIEKGVKFGGEGGDSAYGFHTNQTGAFYLFGSSLSQNLPALRAQPAYSWKNGVGGYRYFVSKLKNDLSAAEYTSTLMLPILQGGLGTAVSPNGELFIAQQYAERVANLSGPPALLGLGHLDPVYQNRILIVGLTADGTGTRFSAVLGCDGSLALGGVVVDPSGRVWLAGTANCSGIPDGSFRNAEASDSTNAFVAVISADGAMLERFAFVGGGDVEDTVSLSFDKLGRPILSGRTFSADFPTSPNGYSRVRRGASDGFIAILNPSLTAIESSTFLGGSASDRISGVTLTASGSIVFAGTTESSDFPTSSAGGVSQGTSHQTQGVVGRLSSDLSQLQMATYLDPSLQSSLVGVDSHERPLLGGWCSSCNSPAFDGALLPPLSRSELAYSMLLRVRADGSGIDYATYIPGGDGFFRLDGSNPPGERVVVISSYSPKVAPIPETQPDLGTPSGEGKKIWLGVVNLADPTRCTMTLQPNEQTIPATEGSYGAHVQVPTGCPWFAFSDFSDLRWDGPRSGLASADLRFTVLKNRSGHSDRSLYVFVNQAVLVLKQEAAGCANEQIMPNEMAFPADGGILGASLDVANGCEWRWGLSVPWLQSTLPRFAGDPRGTGPLNFNVSTGPNRFSPRSGVVTIGKSTLTVTQPGGSCTATVQPMTATLPATGGKVTLHLDTTGTDCQWQAGIVDPSGMGTGATLSSPASGIGDADLEVLVSQTPLNVQRTFTLAVAGITVPITQGAGSCNVTFNSTTADVPVSGGDSLFLIQAAGSACLWNATTSVSWVQILNPTESGSGLLQLRITPNSTGTAREATVEVLGRVLTIRQLGDSNTLVIVSSSGAAVPLTINGVEYAAPGSNRIQLSLPKGSVLRLSAPAKLAVLPEKEYRFSDWNGQAAREVSFVVPSDQDTVTYTASYDLFYRLLLFPPQARGSITASPGSPDGFYRHNTTVTLSAIPDPGYRFGRWFLNPYSPPLNNLMLQPEWKLLMNQAWIAEGSFIPQFTVPPPQVSVDPTISSIRFAIASVPRTYTSWITANGGVANFGFPTVNCGSHPPLFEATLFTHATPTSLIMRPLPNVANLRAPGTYPCVLTIPRTDGATPPSMTFQVPFEVMPIGSEASPSMNAIVNAASFEEAPLVIGSINSLFGEHLADGVANAKGLPLPGELNGTTLQLLTGDGNVSLQLFYVSPTQVNFLVGHTGGLTESTIELWQYQRKTATIPVRIRESSPAIFSANSDGKGAPAGTWLRESNGQRASGDLFVCPQGAGSCVPAQVDLGGAADRVYLTIYGTGLPVPTPSTQVTIGGLQATVTYAGPQPEFAGLQQINILVPRELKGRGEVDLRLFVDGVASNVVKVSF